MLIDIISWAERRSSVFIILSPIKSRRLTAAFWWARLSDNMRERKCIGGIKVTRKRYYLLIAPEDIDDITNGRNIPGFESSSLLELLIIYHNWEIIKWFLLVCWAFMQAFHHLQFSSKAMSIEYFQVGSLYSSPPTVIYHVINNHSPYYHEGYIIRREYYKWNKWQCSGTAPIISQQMPESASINNALKYSAL